MITLQEILDNLTYGELGHVAIGGAAMGHIEAKDYPRIVSCLNGALTAIHKRFLLRTGTVLVQQIEGQTTYYLRREFAVTNPDNPGQTKYLLDSEEDPFEDNLFKVERVFNANNAQFELNNPNISDLNPKYDKAGNIIQTAPIYTPQFDVLHLQPASPPEIVRVEYRANHPKITMSDTFDPALIKLNIPYSILDAISLNVASRIYSPLTAGDGQTAAASTFAYKYELECQRLDIEGMTLDGNLSDSRFEDNGWV